MFVFKALEKHRATLICDTKRIKAHGGWAVPKESKHMVDGLCPKNQSIWWMGSAQLTVSSVAVTAAKQF
jgi:hypothetical protein